MSQFTSRSEFREAMSRLGAAVSVVTSDGPAGRVGLTVSAVCSVTDAPPTLLVCIRRESAMHEVFCTNGRLCVNVLAAGQEEASPLFAGQGALTMAERFTRFGWQTLATGAPALDGAAASIDGHIVSMVEVGTHSVLMCQIAAIRLGEEVSGLVYFGRSYHPLIPAA